MKLANGADRAVQLPPLDPEKFLRWYWWTVARKLDPPTVAEFAIWHQMPPEEARRFLVGHAAWHRRNVRLARLGWAVEVL
jgi:hypothetical protein